VTDDPFEQRTAEDLAGTWQRRGEAVALTYCSLMIQL
jgi:hypothetical protein